MLMKMGLPAHTAYCRESQLLSLTQGFCASCVNHSFRLYLFCNWYIYSAATNKTYRFFLNGVGISLVYIGVESKGILIF